MEDHEELQALFQTYLINKGWSYIQAGYHNFNSNSELGKDFSPEAMFVRAQPDLIAWNDQKQCYFEIKSKSPKYSNYALELQQFIVLLGMEKLGAPVYYVFPGAILKPSEIPIDKALIRHSMFYKQEVKFCSEEALKFIVIQDGKFKDSFLLVNEPERTGWKI